MMADALSASDKLLSEEGKIGMADLVNVYMDTKAEPWLPDIALEILSLEGVWQ